MSGPILASEMLNAGNVVEFIYDDGVYVNGVKIQDVSGLGPFTYTVPDRVRRAMLSAAGAGGGGGGGHTDGTTAGGGGGGGAAMSIFDNPVILTPGETITVYLAPPAAGGAAGAAGSRVSYFTSFVTSSGRTAVYLDNGYGGTSGTATNGGNGGATGHNTSGPAGGTGVGSDNTPFLQSNGIGWQYTASGAAGGAPSFNGGRAKSPHYGSLVRYLPTAGVAAGGLGGGGAGSATPFGLQGGNTSSGTGAIISPAGGAGGVAGESATAAQYGHGGGGGGGNAAGGAGGCGYVMLFF